MMADDYSTFITSQRASVVVGGQFGSEAKGLVASYIANRIADSSMEGMFWSVTNAGAQAGHTTVLADGTKFVCYHLPTAGVLLEQALIYLNAGSIIDMVLLRNEVRDVAKALRRPPGSIWSRLTINPYATVITEGAKEIEANGATAHLGSTQKGVGAALASKIMRNPDVVFGAHADEFIKHIEGKPPRINDPYMHNQTILLEIPQGTGLSLNSSGFYPKTTSRECWVGQGLTDAGLHPIMLGTVNMVMRTYPIRVGHIYKDGVTVGDSGPFYADGPEIPWTLLPGIEPERTTVTNRLRRIARWSSQQYRHGLRMNRPDNVFLTFTNYCTENELKDIVRSMREDEQILGMRVRHWYSWGPRTDQVSTSFGDARASCRG